MAFLISLKDLLLRLILICSQCLNLIFLYQIMVSSQNFIPLTRYPSGSIRELWMLALPVILSSLSSALMSLVDRFILSFYSLDLLNFIVVGTVVFYLGFEAVFFAIGIVAEVFVGRSNGAREYHKVGPYVWQMIWFAMATSILFFPAAWWGTSWLLPKNIPDQAIQYFRTLCYFGPIIVLNAPFIAFFMGIGQSRVLMMAFFIANLGNVGLAVALVFGVVDIIPSYGATGAAVATGISQILQVFILFWFFIEKSMRQRFSTHKFTFNRVLFVEEFRLGIPNAINLLIINAAIIVIYDMMAGATMPYMTAMSIYNIFYCLFSFWLEGIGKTICALASNFLGANRGFLIRKLVKSAFIVHGIFFLLLALPLVVFRKSCIQLFLHKGTMVDLGFFALASDALFWLWLLFLFDGICVIFFSIMLALGKIRFAVRINALMIWLCCVLPVYLILFVWEISPIWVWRCMALELALVCFIFAWKYNTKLAKELEFKIKK